MNGGVGLQPAIVPPEPERHQLISGFWRRFAAFLIDAILLGVVGFFLGIFCFDQFAALGGWGRLVGLLIETLYFGLQNSSLGGGQTVGKRLLGICVVDAAGLPISPLRSLLRSFIFLLPWSLNGAELPVGNLSPTSFVTSLQSMIIFGLGFAILYLAIFNVRTRQSAHDLIARTYVVQAGEGKVAATGIWKGHWAISGAALAVMLLAGVVIYLKFVNTPVMQDMLQLRDAISESREFRPLGVMKGTMYSTSENYTYLSVTARVTRGYDLEQETDNLALLVLRRDPTALGTDRLTVTLVYGYDMGFASASRSYHDSKSVEEWRGYFGSRLIPASGTQPKQ